MSYGIIHNILCRQSEVQKMKMKMKTRKQYDTKDGTFEEIYQLERGDAFKVVLKRVEK